VGKLNNYIDLPFTNIKSVSIFMVYKLTPVLVFINVRSVLLFVLCTINVIVYTCYMYTCTMYITTCAIDNIVFVLLLFALYAISVIFYIFFFLLSGD